MGGSGLWLLRHSPRIVQTPRPFEGYEVDSGGGRIRCPRCGWEPGRDDRWMCACGHAWNTFDTHGVCPDCGHAWTETQCLRCLQWSRHDDWYERDPGGTS